MTVITYAHRPDTAEPWPFASRLGDLVFTGGLLAGDLAKGVDASVLPLPGRPFHGSSIERQIRRILRDGSEALEALGSSLTAVTKINSYHVNGAEIDMALRVRREFFGDDSPPPSTLVRVAETLVPGTTATVDMIGLASSAERIPIYEADVQQGDGYSPAPLGKIFGRRIFLQAARGGGFVFTAGVGPRDVDPEYAETLPGPGARDPEHHAPIPSAPLPYAMNRLAFQVAWILEGLEAILAAAGTSLRDVVRAEVHLADLRGLATLDRVWARYFPEDPPARVVVATALARPDVMLVEIELIAVDPTGPYRKQTVTSAGVPHSLSPEPQAVRAGPYLFLSTQMASDYSDGVAAQAAVAPGFPYHGSPIRRQAEYIIQNTDAICRAAGTSVTNLLRRRCIHADLYDFADAEEIWNDHVGDRIPPSTVVRTERGLAVPGCVVQYDLIAGIPG